MHIAAESWPPSWLACARGWLAPSSRPANYTVAWDGVGLAHDDELDAFTTAELLVEERTGPAQWRIRGGGSFVAEIDEATRHVRVKTRSQVEDPSLALGNALRALVATTMPTAFDGVMIHACAGVHRAHGGRGDGVVVAGVSTAGKTTLALGFSQTAYLSDDVALVAHVTAEDGPRLLRSPFFGAAGVPSPPSSPQSTRLRAIGVLVGKQPAGERSRYARVSAAQGATALLQHVARFTRDKVLSARLFDLAVSLAARVPVVLVHRSLDDASDDVIEAILAEARC